MPRDVVVFPDVEDLIRDYLADELPRFGHDVPVHIQIPNPRPEAFVTVPRVGGPRRNLVVDTATVSADCWHLRSKQALELAQIVRGIINALPGKVLDGHPVYRVDEFTGPGNLPDGLSSHARYTQAFSIFIRGFSMEPIEP